MVRKVGYRFGTLISMAVFRSRKVLHSVQGRSDSMALIYHLGTNRMNETACALKAEIADCWIESSDHFDELRVDFTVNAGIVIFFFSDRYLEDGSSDDVPRNGFCTSKVHYLLFTSIQVVVLINLLD